MHQNITSWPYTEQPFSVYRNSQLLLTRTTLYWSWSTHYKTFKIIVFFTAEKKNFNSLAPWKLKATSVTTTQLTAHLFRTCIRMNMCLKGKIQVEVYYRACTTQCWYAVKPRIEITCVTHSLWSNSLNIIFTSSINQLFCINGK